MNPNIENTTRQPMIIKYNQVTNNGIKLHVVPKYCIGYITKGVKYIYCDSNRKIINKGELFYLNTGQYYIENIPEKDGEFEELLFLYTPEQLNNILHTLSVTFKLKIENNHICEKCSQTNFVICNSWSNLSHFFNSVNRYIKDNIFNSSHTAELLKMTELIYLIILDDKCCTKLILN